MHPDAHLEIGSTHDICEDYARGAFVIHQGKKLPVAIVSDGCSSSPDTDFGSRILTWTTFQEVTAKGEAFRPSDIALKSNAPAQAGAMAPTSLDATLLVLVPTEEGMVKAVVVGDGFLSGKRRGGSIETWRFSYESPNGGSAPGYLTYTTDPDRWSTWTTQNGEGFWNTRKVSRYLDGVLQGEPLIQVVDNPGNVAATVLLDPTEYDILAVFSDGADSFQRRVSDTFKFPVPMAGAVQIPPDTVSIQVIVEAGRPFITGTYLTRNIRPVTFHEVIEQCMAIKGSKGRFVGRRCQRFLSQFCSTHGWSHYDDFSMAALWTGDVVRNPIPALPEAPEESHEA